VEPLDSLDFSFWSQAQSVIADTLHKIEVHLCQVNAAGAAVLHPNQPLVGNRFTHG